MRPAETKDPEKDGPVRIDHLITDSGVGGAEKILYELVKRLDPDKYRCRVIVMKKPGAIAKMIAEAGIPLISLDLPVSVGLLYPLFLIPAAKRLLGHLREDPPRILHCWLFQANIMGRIAAGFSNVPVNISSFHGVEMTSWFHYPVDRATKGLVTRYLMVCKASARHFLEKLRLAPDKISVVFNGISLAPFKGCDRMSSRGGLSLSMQEMVIGAVGRLHRDKDLEMLIRALPIVLSVFSGLNLLVAGDGPERERLERYADKCSVAKRVKFLGDWDKVPRMLAALDLFVQSSRTEGMPMVLLEAMASGLAVVATDVGGVSELVVAGKINSSVSGETGILVQPGDHESLAQAIIELLGNQARRQAMAKAAGKRMEAEFTINKMIENYTELYDELSNKD